MNPESRCLIVMPAWLGDAVMAQSLCLTLKRRHPTLIIDVLAPPALKYLFIRMPEVRDILELPFAHGELSLLKRYRLAKTLRARAYTQAIVLPNSWKSALIPFWARIPKRTGWHGECRYGLLNDRRRLDKTNLPSMTQRFVALAASDGEELGEIPIPHLRTDAKTRESTLHTLSLKRPQTPLLVLCPGAEYGPSKRWPHYKALAQRMIAKNWHIWILGTAHDHALAQAIASLDPARIWNGAGKTNLDHVVDLIAEADAVVSNDSGLMHVTCATSTPLVAIYGSTSPQFTPPLRAQQTQILYHSIACSPCFARTCRFDHYACLRDITVSEVVNAIQRVSLCAY